MKTLRWLALGTDLIALATVMLGSWTRINGAGLSCPDWPLCHGHLVPTLAGGTIWEWLHRLLASIVAPLVVALLVVAWRQRHRAPFIAPAAGSIAVLFLVQVLFGAATVHLANTPISVVLHWGTAMAFIAAVSALAVFAAVAERADAASGTLVPLPPAGMSGILLGTAAIAFVTMCFGAYVSSSGAGLACLSIPGCAGNVVVYTQGQYIQMTHRFLAGGTLLCAAGSLALAWARPVSSRVRAAVAAGVVLVCVQVLLGLLNVALRLPTELREAHAVNAALVFVAFVIAAMFAFLDVRSAAQVDRAVAR
jgi:heme A synthase